VKILFTADWHIKLGQKNVPVEWQKNRFLMFFNQLNDIIRQHNIKMLILGGDTFDRLPTIEELELYFQFLSMIDKNVDIIIYSGNHEAVKKNTTFLTNLKLVTESINVSAKIIDDFYSTGEFDIIPYNRLKEYTPQDIDFHNRLLFTHVRGEIPPHVKPEVPLELFDRWELVLAGDLHSFSNSQRNILYPGSPITTSFHRREVDTGVLIIDADTLDYRWEKLNLPQLIRLTVTDPSQMVKTDFHHTIYELEGDIQELAKVTESELLDKKIVFKENPSALSFSKDMSIEGELELYLESILKLDKHKIEKVLKEYNDSIKDSRVE
jgi:DNA repair exonuclease SbcCD nuclease subunit